MGNRIMENLEKTNILRDYGKVSLNLISIVEEKRRIKFPLEYVNFITKHNGARVIARIFNYFDSNRKRKNRDSIAFISVEKIDEFICGLLDEYVDDPGRLFL